MTSDENDSKDARDQAIDTCVIRQSEVSDKEIYYIMTLVSL